MRDLREARVVGAHQAGKGVGPHEGAGMFGSVELPGQVHVRNVAKTKAPEGAWGSLPLNNNVEKKLFPDKHLRLL